VVKPTLSVVIPIFNEELVIDELDLRLHDLLIDVAAQADMEWEVVFIDDGSKDKSLIKLRQLALAEPRYRVLSFSRNFGHQMAITAGMDRADGDAVVIMDADLQDPPEVVREMVALWKQGYDVVYAVRNKRHGETLFKRLTAAGFYRALRALTGVDIPVDTGDFRLMSRPVVLTMRALRERHRFVRGLVAWAGFRQTAVKYDRQERYAGETKYPLHKMLRFAADGITSFSTVPLRAATWLGLLAGLLAVGVVLWAIYVKFFIRGVVPGWTTLMIMVAFSSSVQLLMMGVLGEYIGRAYEELKGRPLYVVAEELNFGANQLAPTNRGAKPNELGGPQAG
jgi:glycosyltransferase involved in cell wall biosynthesis